MGAVGLCLTLASSGLLLASEPADAQPVRVSSTSTVPCRGCSLTIDSITTLGAGAKEGEYFPHPVYGFELTGRGQILVISGLPVMMFDTTGRPAGTFGRRGQGPGEFPWMPTAIRRGVGDTLYAFMNLQRVMVFDPALNYKRTIRVAEKTSSLVPLSDGHFAVLGSLPDSIGPHNGGSAQTARAVFDRPLFLIFDGEGALIRRVGTSRPFAEWFLVAGTNGTVWTAKRAPYELRQWSQDGRLLRQINRVTPSFPATPYRGVFVEPPPTLITRVFQDRRGFLWVAYSVAKPDWATAMYPNNERCCYSIVEVLDPTTGGFLGSVRVPVGVTTILEGGLIIGYARGENDESLAPLYRARLTVPAGYQEPGRR